MPTLFLIKTMLTLTRRFTFEMAHALSGYDGACRHIHGHSYKLYITILGAASTDTSSPKLGMVIDFTDLKRVVNEAIIDRFDHALVLRSGSLDPRFEADVVKEWQKLVFTPYQPTCENMVVEFANSLIPKLPSGIKLHEIKLYETENSYVTYRP